MKLIILLLVLFTAIFSSCYYDNEERMYPKVVSNVCDTINVTYVKNIEPMMSQFCNTCHGGSNASGGVSLTSYDLVKAAVEKTFTTVENGSMPKNGIKLDDCKIVTLKKWKDAGTPY